LERVQARLLGVALNDITRSVRSYYYDYNQYSHYYAEEPAKTGAKENVSPAAQHATASIWPTVKEQSTPFELTLVGEPPNNGAHTPRVEKTS
jgi:hypothetical protein